MTVTGMNLSKPGVNLVGQSSSISSNGIFPKSLTFGIPLPYQLRCLSKRVVPLSSVYSFAYFLYVLYDTPKNLAAPLFDLLFYIATSRSA